MTQPDIDLAHFKKRLLELKAELSEASDLSASSRQAVKLDQTSVGRVSRVDAMERQAMAQETERRRRADLLHIEAALQKIEEGEYGYCVICGDPIPEKRLELSPMTQFCIHHAR